MAVLSSSTFLKPDFRVYLQRAGDSLSHPLPPHISPLPGFPCRKRNCGLNKFWALKGNVHEGRTGGNNSRETSSEVLRRILAEPEITLAPACHDALSAKLVEEAGFKMTFMSGFAVSAARAGLPDAGLISYGEMLDQGQKIASAISIPLIGDGDNGYGTAMNVKRTVKGYQQAGIAGILIEDQAWPKACGHTRGRKVVSREEAVMKIKAAVDARDEGKGDILIVARSDARQAVSLEEAIWRAKAFHDCGADMVFIDALTSRDEMKYFCQSLPNALKMANMLEGGGLTPFLSPMEFQDLGFNVVAYPLSLIGVSIRAMQDALRALKSGRIPPPSLLPTFPEIKTVVGFDAYYAEEEKYNINLLNLSQDQTPPLSTPNAAASDAASGTTTSATTTIVDVPDESSSSEPVLVAEVLGFDDKITVIPPQANVFSVKMLRVKITAANGSTKLDFRVPAGFLGGLTKVVPGVAGLDLENLIRKSLNNVSDINSMSENQILDFVDKSGDRIQVFIE